MAMGGSRCGDGQLNFFSGKEYDIFPGKVIVVGPCTWPTTSNAVVPAVASVCSMHAVRAVTSLCMKAKGSQRTKESQESAPSSRSLEDFTCRN